jgi:hypothetical protein
MIAHSNETAPRQKAVTYKLAQRPDELRSAFHLVYQNYLQAGLIRPNVHRLRVTPWHLLTTTEVFVGLDGDGVICTASLVADGELGVPMESIFPEEIEARRLMGLRFAEVSCLADRRDSTQHSFPILKRLFELIAQSSRRRNIDILLIAVHPHHRRFYERFLGFEPIGDTKNYDAVCDHPAVPLELDLLRLPIHHPRAYRTLFENSFPDAILDDKPPIHGIPAAIASAVRFYGPPMSREAAFAPNAGQAVCA